MMTLNNYSKSIFQIRVKAFILITSICIFYLFLNNEYYHVYDASYYNDLSKSFIGNDGFSIYNFPKSFRGVIFPLFLFFFDYISTDIIHSQVTGWRIFISILLGFTFVLLPILFFCNKVKKISLIQYVAPILILIYFWYGLINNPLSDLVALCFLIIGLVCLYKAFFLRNYFIIFIIAVICGIFLYAAYNTRTIYLFSILFLVLLFIYSLIFDKDRRKKVLIICFGVLIGICILGSLQALINYHQYSAYSIGVVTNYANEENLFIFQLKNGIYVSQYETYISSDYKDYPSAGIIFVDKIGQLIVEENNISSMKDFFLVVLTNPLEFIVIYAKHFINMLNPVWGGGAYITDLNEIKIVRSILNYTILFFVVKQLNIIRKQNTFKGLVLFTKKRYINIFCILSILISSLAILPGAVEQRFFLPMYFVAYSILVYKTNYKQIWSDIKLHPILNALIYTGGFIILSICWSNTYANTVEGITFSIL